MAFYKHLGPIAFHTESKSAEIFITQNQYLLQPKSTNSVASINELRRIADATNKQFNKSIMQVYEEQGKTATLMIERCLGQFEETGTDYTAKSIEILCLFARILINSFIQIGVKSINTEI